MTSGILVSVVDDDASVRESVPDFLRAFGFDARSFDSAESFLASDVVNLSRCLILDVAMPGISGPELFKLVRRRPLKTPAIFITAHGNRNLCKELIDQGAADCLFKPFEPADLLKALRAALSECGES